MLTLSSVSASVCSHSHVFVNAAVFSYSHVCACMHLCMTCVFGCHWKAEKGIGFSRVRITGVCKLSDMGTRIELRPTARAIHALNHRAFYLILFEKRFIFNSFLF